MAADRKNERTAADSADTEMAELTRRVEVNELRARDAEAKLRRFVAEEQLSELRAKRAQKG